MASRAFRITVLLVFLGCTIGLRADGLPAGEKTKIEALLAHLGGLGNARFIRNGTGYDSKSAAKFLRRKWQANEKDIKSAADFIAVAATRSSTSGKPYLIRLEGAAATPCAAYLTARLKKLETQSNGQSP